MERDNGRAVMSLPLMTAVVVLVSTVLHGAPALAAPTCFGKTATIVGTNRDRGKPVPLKGTPGDDVIVGLDGWDLIDGRGGDDRICGGRGDDFVKAGSGDDKVRGGGGLDTLKGGTGRDRLWGDGDTDSLFGGPGGDRLFGGSGSEDSLIGGPGSDVMHGGGGYDLAEFWDSPRGIEADLRTGSAVGRGKDKLSSIEGIIATRYDDVLYGDELSNMLQGGEGDDFIYGLANTDGGHDILRTAGGINLLDGGEGPDIVSYNLVPWPVTADLSAGTTTYELGHDTLIGVEHLIGSKQDDILTGDDADNLIVGNWGNDSMDGRGGVDDLGFFDSRSPTTANLGEGTATGGYDGTETDTFAGFENIIGSAYSDVLVGSDEPNLIWGGSRNDVIVGLGGDDSLFGQAGSDEGDGGAGIDHCETEFKENCEDAQSARAALDPWINITAYWRRTL